MADDTGSRHRRDEKAYEITADLPGMDDKNIEVKAVDGVLTIKGEKQEEKEEKKKDYYLQERSFGSFQRSFGLPDGVDQDKIEASFKKGVLIVTLPKRPEAQKPTKKIEVKGHVKGRLTAANNKPGMSGVVFSRSREWVQVPR